MKTTFLVIALTMVATTSYAKPMTASVSSWEGQFELSPANIPLSIDGLPSILMWKYELNKGSRGTAIGFSSQGGDMILEPTPNGKGIQPVYSTHAVVQDPDNTAHIIVLYDVQGSGGQKVVESYRYDGKTIAKESTTINGGKPEYKWSREDSVRSIPARRASDN